MRVRVRVRVMMVNPNPNPNPTLYTLPLTLPLGPSGMAQMMVSVPAGVAPGQPFQVSANGQARQGRCRGDITLGTPARAHRLATCLALPHPLPIHSPTCRGHAQVLTVQCPISPFLSPYISLIPPLYLPISPRRCSPSSARPAPCPVSRSPCKCRRRRCRQGQWGRLPWFGLRLA